MIFIKRYSPSFLSVSIDTLFSYVKPFACKSLDERMFIMPRIPTQARRARIDDYESDEQIPAKKEPARKRVSLSQHLLSTVQIPNLGRPPRDEDEKRQVLAALVYLKSSGKTNKECADLLFVSERTIVNYLNDEKYLEIQGELQSEAKMRGYSTITMVIDDALSELYSIMKTDKSGFVRFKSAEALLNYAGYNMPREEQQKDSREEVTRFLQLVEERAGRVQVNVQINQPGVLPAGEHFDTVTIDEAKVVEEEIPVELQQYYKLVGPGGTLPGTNRQHEPLPIKDTLTNG